MHDRGNLERAEMYLNESLEIAGGIEAPIFLAESRAILGEILVSRQEFERALAILTETLVSCRDLHNAYFAASALDSIACSLMALGKHDAGLTIAAASDAIYETLETERQRSGRSLRDLDGLRAASSQVLSAAAGEEARRRGSAMTLERVIGYALESAARTVSDGPERSLPPPARAGA